MNDQTPLLGRFLEFSIPTTDIIESLGFYKLLGFQELKSGEVWEHKYAVVSDGVLNIGLHDGKFDRPALTFVHHDVARQARSMTDHGFHFEYLRINPDVFNEIGFYDRDENLVTMIEARTFSPADELFGDSVCGSLFELTLPVRDAMRAAQFWAPLAPELQRLREEPTTHMRFNAGGIPLGLSESIALNGPSLCFRCYDQDRVWTSIAQHGFKFKEFPGFEGALMSLKAPEGTMLYMFAEDFLGEMIVVEEGDEAAEEEFARRNRAKKKGGKQIKKKSKTKQTKKKTAKSGKAKKR